ncbi:putative LRR receptor-like serine/threonine-protein kinase [Vitis vinifera]|uniref:non-specific serine/threonine protein kinase n=1 Tax=Vitis vinifera TaxID=29760 RepID=A0A438CVR6_VITVI|nr:putative LRR receptor-like serine/threonine-protein kinase [Vitis vinifera]
MLMERFSFLYLVGALSVQSCLLLLAASPSNFTDQSALLAFKSDIIDPTHSILGGNWTQETSFCNWVGVSCSRRRQRVTALRLQKGVLRALFLPILAISPLSCCLTSLEGKIPPSISHCRRLEFISLASNWLSGGIPEELGILPKLDSLLLGGNNLRGTIPSSLGNISTLELLGLRETGLTGSIPSLIFNISSLLSIILTGNSISGSLPVDICQHSPNIEELLFTDNQLSGQLPSGIHRCRELLLHLYHTIGPIPSSIGNISSLQILFLEDNKIQGSIPSTLGNLLNLSYLVLELNELTGAIPQEIFNISSLQILSVVKNNLSGNLPSTTGLGLPNLMVLFLAGNGLSGKIPPSLSNYSQLTKIDIGNNLFTGPIPPSLGNLKFLQTLSLGENQLKVEPGRPELSFITALTNCRLLEEITMQNNPLGGIIPNSIGNLSNHVRNIVAFGCQLKGLWSLGNLLFLNLSFNSLGGSLPSDMGTLTVIEDIDLSWNKLIGNIPGILGTFESLYSLNLSRNSFQEAIPETLGKLRALEFMDLSQNNLSGTIPKSFEALSHLKYLNLSFNNLSGEIPNGGPFVNFTAQSFLENKALCGRSILLVSPCPTNRTQESKTKQVLLKYVLPGIAAVVHRMISYLELQRATNSFCETNLLGVGSFGSVYKGILSDGTTVAVKVLNLRLEGAFKSFDAECKVLARIRHRNLIKVISSCSNLDVRALVLQYMSNGSLEKWLYSHNYCLNLFQRVSIMLDVALALEYLHHSQSEPVVHCDLKPSNVLLDDDMVAHVGDFGLAKILVENKVVTQTKTLGTLGYIAPEYGSEGRVSTKGDVYSYGIMLLEIFTRKKPTDEMFSEELSLRQWVNASLPENVMEVVDGGLLSIEDGEAGGDVMATQSNLLLAIMELGLECSRDLPEERKGIKDVVVKLNKIKLQFLRRTRA